METEKTNVKVTAYVSPDLRKQIEKFAAKNRRNLSDTVKYLVETHHEFRLQAKATRRIKSPNGLILNK